MVARVIAGFIALVLAAFGALVVTQAVETADERALAKLSDATAFFASEPIPAGTSGDMLSQLVEVRSLPSDLLPDGAVSDLTTLDDLVAGASILPGEILVSERFIKPELLDPTLTLRVPAGLDEFSLTFRREQVLGGAIQAGDLVSLYSSIDLLDAEGTLVGSETNIISSGLLVTSVNGPFTTKTETDEVALPEDLVIVSIAATKEVISQIINSQQLGTVSISRNKNGASR